MTVPRDASGALERRIVGFFTALLIAVQIGAFLFIRYAIEQTARNNLRVELDVGERVFKRLLEQNTEQLVEATSVLTYDYGFREAVTTKDRDTILSALSNHSSRIKATGMTLIDLSGLVVADTLRGHAAGSAFTFPALLQRAADTRRASAVRVVEGRVYQIVVVPVLAPLPIAWVAMYFVIDDTAAQDLKRITGLDVTFLSLSTQGGASTLHATTLTGPVRSEAEHSLPRLVPAGPDAPAGPATHAIAGEEFEVLASTLDRQPGTTIAATLQRSMREGLKPYDRLQYLLLALGVVSLAASAIGSIRIARRISQPVRELADAARQIGSGTYASVNPATMAQKDEVGELAQAFDTMSRGLAERDRMRDVLGKVASPAVAERLLAERIELGGEDRLVTVLFADLRNFTSLCETLAPGQSLELLNRYLTVISECIDTHEGVIDKYLGDGTMAVFGAPIARPDDARRALLAAMDIARRIRDLGRDLAAQGLPHPDVGVGINTSIAVAGNVGSPSRLNYTVLGDGVNLAARLEGLTKRYQVPIVAGESTRNAVDGVVYRELDRVRVRGKTVPVHIFQPLALSGSLTAREQDLLAKHHAAIDAYRSRRWSAARDIFTLLATHPDYQRLAEIYLGYLDQAEHSPPGEDWDGVFTVYDK
ncbi:MAG: HAMP domain-containing protein [Betaproteobacteria bacterium]|nr:HAMP domain-containing protein [Betaproteobacteria bacterium]